MKPKIIDGQSMQWMSECRVRFEHCGRLFFSPVIYRSAFMKNSRFWGPCSASLAIFTMCLLTLPICRDFL